jgi:SOS-response transcriptional repressor LexA
MGRTRRSYCRRLLGYREEQVLRYIRVCLASEGIAPSYGMIRDELGFAHKGHVADIVKQLEQRGLVSRVGSGRVRRIRLEAVARVHA